MSGPFGAGALNLFSGVKKFYPYTIDQSLRFNDGDSAFLKRTPASAGNRKTWTWSAWVKRGIIGTRQILFSADDNATNATHLTLEFQADDNFRALGGTEQASSQITKETAMVFRDPAAWYHLVFVMDATNTVARLYVNGDEITDWNTNNNPTNQDYQINAATQHFMGRFGSSLGTSYFDGYLAEVNFIDGTALDASSFGETKSGIWIPKDYTGSYGTNGFKLAFQDSAALGDDTSGNGNDFTANNLASTDQMLDTPTSNFATLNPNDSTGVAGNFTVLEGNLGFTVDNNSGYRNVSSTFFPEGLKGYYEYRVNVGTPNFFIGMYPDNLAPSSTSYTVSTTIYLRNSGALSSGTTTLKSGMTPAFSTGDVGMVAFDFTGSNRYIWFGRNGTWGVDQSGNQQDPSTGTNPAFTFTSEQQLYFASNSGSGTQTIVVNFGQDSTFAGATTAGGNADGNGIGDFKYAPPSGFLALNAANLPEPSITPLNDDIPEDYFNTVLWTGDTTSPRSITGVGFQPDWTWIKRRNATKDHGLFDSVRGSTLKLESNTTAAEITGDNGKIDSFDSDGFTISTGTTDNSGINGSGNTLVAWNWKAGGTAVSNTDGSITSSVSASPEAGFSIVTWTGDGNSSGNVGTGLSSDLPLGMAIVKRRDASSEWQVGHSGNQGLNFAFHLELDDTTASSGSAPYFMGSQGSGGNIFYLASGGLTSSANFVAYCFQSIEGFSKFGSYVGNGSTDGAFVYTGFRPAWVMAKRFDTTSSWQMWDTVRSSYNPTTHRLRANLANDEDTGNADIDTLSNGFKFRNTGTNVTNGTYIYLAFAEQPFKYANAR